MTDTFKIGDTFKITGAGYKPAEIWEVIDVSDTGISVIDVRERRFDRERWAVLDLSNTVLEIYDRQNFIKRLAEGK